MNEWQPIETAPKDRTKILVGRFVNRSTEFMYVAWWARERWRILEHVKGLYSHLETAPTHWINLPDPPGFGDDQGKGP